MQFQPDHQHLPIPIGGRAPAHRSARRPAWVWRRRTAVLYCGAVAISSVAVVVAMQPQHSAMYVDSSGLHIDGLVLRAVQGPAPGAWYTGAATVLLRTAPGGVTEGFAAATINQYRVTGACTERADVEHCSFSVGGTRLDAVDRFYPTTRSWTRRYSDGRSITIDVAADGRPIPVALPLDSG